MNGTDPDDRPPPRSARYMAKSKKTSGATRLRDLKAMLDERRLALTREVRGQIRDVRTESAGGRDPIDQEDGAEADGQGEIGLTLIQMKSETLQKIDAALRRLAEGSYGDCFECGEPIAEARLRALPFAVRCRECEETRESAEQSGPMARRRSAGSLYTNATD
jgi:DnaK suppressor protein